MNDVLWVLLVVLSLGFAAIALHESAHLIVVEQLMGNSTINYEISINLESLRTAVTSLKISGGVPIPDGNISQWELLLAAVAGPLAGVIFSGVLVFSKPKSDAVLFTSFFIFVHQLVYLFVEPGIVLGLLPINAAMVPMIVAGGFTAYEMVDTPPQ